MSRRSARSAIFLAMAMLAPAAAQQPPHRPDQQPPGASEVRLPNGKLQQDEILKDDHQKSIKDAAQLVELAESLKADLEKEDSHVLSIANLKKTEEIEKIARRIRSRLRR